jgi:hypothetical protein
MVARPARPTVSSLDSIWKAVAPVAREPGAVEPAASAGCEANRRPGPSASLCSPTSEVVALLPLEAGTDPRWLGRTKQAGQQQQEEACHGPREGPGVRPAAAGL